jgi:hypothetical protein
MTAKSREISRPFKKPPRDKAAANMMAIGLFIAAGGLIYLWDASLMQMGWLKETTFEGTYIASYNPYIWTIKDVPRMLASGLGGLAAGSVLFTLGVRRMLKISTARDEALAAQDDPPTAPRKSFERQ